VEIGARPHLGSVRLETLLMMHGGLTAVDQEGHQLAAAGITDHGNGVGLAWAVIGYLDRNQAVRVVRAMKRGLAAAARHMHWIEAHVDISFARSQRLLLALGFVPVAGPDLTYGNRTFLRFRYVKDS
jgi:hypothetical protein